MFTLALFLFFIATGFLADLLELSVIFKLPLLICAGAVLAADYSKTKGRTVRHFGLYACALMVQCLYTIHLVLLKTSSQYASLSTGSIYQIVGIGLLPWLGMLLLGRRVMDIQDRRLPMNILYFGMLLVLILNLALARTSLGTINTERIYGDVARSYSATQSFRVALPTFPGVVSGGIFSGVAAVMGCALAKYGGHWWERVSGWVGLVVGTIAIYFTETRSAFLTLIPLSILIMTGGLQKLTRYPKAFASMLVIVPFSIPYVYPSMVVSLEQIMPQIIEENLSRSNSDSFWRLSGRVDIWNDATAVVTKKYLTPLGYGPMGEIVSGFSAYSDNLLPGLRLRVQSTHTHNMYLNALFESGILGLLLWMSTVWMACYYLVRSTRSGQISSMILLAGITAAGLMGATESILSVNYVYFVPLFLLMILEFILRGDVFLGEHPNMVSALAPSKRNPRQQ